MSWWSKKRKEHRAACEVQCFEAPFTHGGGGGGRRNKRRRQRGFNAVLKVDDYRQKSRSGAADTQVIPLVKTIGVKCSLQSICKLSALMRRQSHTHTCCNKTPFLYTFAIFLFPHSLSLSLSFTSLFAILFSFTHTLEIAGHAWRTQIYRGRSFALADPGVALGWKKKIEITLRQDPLRYRPNECRWAINHKARCFFQFFFYSFILYTPLFLFLLLFLKSLLFFASKYHKSFLVDAAGAALDFTRWNITDKIYCTVAYACAAAHWVRNITHVDNGWRFVTRNLVNSVKSFTVLLRSFW